MFVGMELVSNRQLRTASREAADFVLKRFRAEKVLMQVNVFLHKKHGFSVCNPTLIEKQVKGDQISSNFDPLSDC
jgi:hypothetical protein